MVRRNTAGVLLAVAAFVALSGCLTVGMGVDSTVASDGTIERYEFRMNLSGQAYSMMAMAGDAMGGANGSMGSLEDAEEDIRANVTDEFASVGDVETNVTETDEYMTVTVVLHDAVPAEGGNISVSTEGDTVVYRDDTLNRSFGGSSGFGGGSMGEGGDGSMDGTGGMDGMENPELHLRYRLEMPGEIRDSNADTVEGDVATWNRSYTGDEIQDAGFTAEAESAAGGGGMPGFGAVVAAAALLTVGLLGSRRRRDG